MFFEKYWGRILLTVFVIFLLSFFGSIIAMGAHNKKYSDEYLQACHAAGGTRVTIRVGRGWPKYVCLKSQYVLNMGDLESSLVTHPYGIVEVGL